MTFELESSDPQTAPLWCYTAASSVPPNRSWSSMISFWRPPSCMHVLVQHSIGLAALCLTGWHGCAACSWPSARQEHAKKANQAWSTLGTHRARETIGENNGEGRYNMMIEYGYSILTYCWSYFACSCSFFTYNWSSFAYSWSFSAYCGKVRLISTSADCKQISSTVSREAPTVSKRAYRIEYRIN